MVGIKKKIFFLIFKKKKGLALNQFPGDDL